MIEKFILDRDPLIEIEPEDFSDDADSSILIRERVRGTTLEGAFKKVRGNIVKETGNTLTILPRCGKSTIISKMDVANTTAQQGTAQQGNTKPNSAETKKRRKMPKGEKVTNETESGSEDYKTQAEGEVTAVATENNGKEEEQNIRQNNKHVIQEAVKWEISQQRVSKRNKRKPDRLEQNLMVSKRF